MPLQISRTDARISIQTTKSQLSIETRRAKLDLSHKEERIDIRTELPRVVIDQYECFASAGLMGPIDLTRQAAQAAKKQALDYAARVAGEGDLMAAIENKVNPQADIAWQNGTTMNEFGLDYIPKARPRITIEGGEVEITSRGYAAGAKNGVEGEITPGSISINYTFTGENFNGAICFN
jgi:hypothetical protein